MPGSVQLASPTVVFPHSLCKAFRRNNGYPMLENRYANGEGQFGLLSQTMHRQWALNKQLTDSEMSTLRTFFLANIGKPFYFYDLYETVPKFTGYDPTGVAVNGRYTVKFDGVWTEQISTTTGSVPIQLVERI